MDEGIASRAASHGNEDAKRRWDSVTSQIHADRPISDLENDLLERGTFCFSLAHAIKEWKGEESLVIGLFGPWGSGKSSVKNIVAELLRKSEPQLPIIEFNPWSWSGEDRLASAFFEELGAALPTFGDQVDHEDLSQKWNVYATRLTLGSTALGHLKTASEFAGIPWVPMILGTLSAATKSTGEFAEQASKAHAAVTTESSSVQALKEQLSDEFKKLSRPILVIMDDVDRLTNDEIRLLFRVVKTNADFPNIVFLLLYDRIVVERALEGHVGSSGRAYMEKIVQVGFDVPLPQQQLLDGALFSGLDAIIGSDTNRMRFNADRWQHFYSNGLQPFFTTLRSVRRFLSSFAFHVGLFLRENELEVNMVDLIGIEVLRVFDPELYRELASAPEIVFGDPLRGFGYRNNEREVHQQCFNNWVLLAREMHREPVKELARALFPQVDWLLSNQGQGMGFETTWLRELRVCHSDIFARYFSLLVPEGDVTQAFITKLLAATNSRSRFRDLLLGLDSPGKIAAALNRFEVFANDVEFADAKEVILAIFDVGEELPEERSGTFRTSADFHAWRIVNEVLRKEPDVATRSKVALECLEKTQALWFPCRFLSLEEPKEGDRLSQHRDVFDNDTIKGAVECCVRKIRKAAIKNTIVGKRLAFYLWRWRDWAGEEEPRKWASAFIQAPDRALLFVAAMTHEVHSSTGQTSSRYKELDLKNIDAFVDAAALQAVVAPYFADQPAGEHESLAREHADVIRAAKLAFENRRRANSST